MSARPQRPLRVVLVLKTSQGGLWTVPHVEELCARGHDVVAVLPPGPGRLREALAARGVRVVDSAFDFRFRPSLPTLRGLARLRGQLRRLRPDVVHYHLYASALAARLSTVGMPVRRVHMVAGPLYLESPLIRAAERVLVRLDSVTIGGSQHTARLYRALGLPWARTPAIPYGVDVERFSPPAPATRAGVRAELGIEADTFLAIMVAYVYAPKRAVHRGRGIKGHDVLLDAWRTFHDRHPRSRLLLVGAGFDDAAERYRADLIRQYGLSGDKAVTWLPTVPDVRRYYAAADLSVSPSLSENHGAALEAAAMGVPCVVSDAGGLPETVDDTTGWLVPAGDPARLATALEAAYEEFRNGRLALRGERGRERMVRRFDQRRAAAAVADVVEGAAGRALPLARVRAVRQ
jgi:glycosyltransferase involved in cell wall biosynthesis